MQNQNSNKSFYLAILILFLPLLILYLRLDSLMGFVMIIMVLSLIFGLSFSIKGIKEPNTIRKIIGLLLHGIYVCFIIYLIGNSAVEFYKTFYGDKTEKKSQIGATKLPEIEVIFPDTVSVNRIFPGKIRFLTTVDEMGDSIDRSTIKGILLLFPKNENRNKIHITPIMVTAVNNKEINFNLKFSREGDNQIIGLLYEASTDVDFNLNNINSDSLFNNYKNNNAINKKVFVRRE